MSVFDSEDEIEELGREVVEVAKVPPRWDARPSQAPLTHPVNITNWTVGGPGSELLVLEV